MRSVIPNSLGRVRPVVAAALAAALLGCASSDELALAPAVEAPPEWRVGYTWRFMTDDRLRAATRATVEACLLGRAPGLETVALAPTADGFDLVDRASGERRLWMAIMDDPTTPAAKTLNLNWADDIGAETPVRFLRSVDKTLQGEPPC